jgi:hypothetical protein
LRGSGRSRRIVTALYLLHTPGRDHIVEFVLLFERDATGKLEIVLDFYD